MVLNSDSPTLPTSLLIDTARLLADPGERAVLGPAVDGGYYLLGVKRAHRQLFDGIAWSTGDVTRQTLERAAAIGLRVHLLPAWYDVDDMQSLRTLQSELCEGSVFSAGLKAYVARNSARLLQELLDGSDLRDRLGENEQRAAE